MTRFQLQALSVATWAEEQETGLSLAFCFVGLGKKRKQNEAATEAETPPVKKINPQTPNTFPKRKKVNCLLFLSGASFYLFILLLLIGGNKVLIHVWAIHICMKISKTMRQHWVYKPYLDKEERGGTIRFQK